MAKLTIGVIRYRPADGQIPIQVKTLFQIRHQLFHCRIDVKRDNRDAMQLPLCLISLEIVNV